MNPGDAYLSGGWPLVAIVLASGVIVYLVRENASQRKEIRDLTQSSLDMLKHLQARDQEELRTYREERRRREAGGA